MPAMLARRALQEEQVPLLALAAGVADHAGGPADHGDGAMPGLLEPAQDHQGHQDVPRAGYRPWDRSPRRASAAAPSARRGKFASSVVWWIRLARRVRR